MANYTTLITAIQSVITENGNNEITGNILQQTLLAIISSFGTGYQFVGIAVPSTNPGTPDQRVFYLCSTGTYPNFGGVVIPSGSIAVLYYDTDWHSSVFNLGVGEGSITQDKIEPSFLEKLLSGYVYIEIALPSTNPGTPTRDCFYIAGAAGTYQNFSNLIVNNFELSILKYTVSTGVWTKESIPLTEVVNNFTDGGVDKALSAEMGKTLYALLFGGTGSFEVDIANTISWTSGKFIAAADPQGSGLTIGNEYNSSNQNSFACGYIDISGNSSIRITLLQLNLSTGAPGLCFYDSNHNVVGSVWRANLSPAAMVEETINVPSNAVYFRTTWRSDLGDFHCYVNQTGRTGGILEKIEGTQGAIKDITSEFDWTQMKYRNQTDGTLGTSSSNQSYGSNLVDISAYKQLRVYLPFFNLSQTNAGWAFYDKNGRFLLGNACIGTNSIQMIEKTISIPEGAKYFATTWRKDGGGFSCKGVVPKIDDYFGISTQVMEIKNEIANVKDYGAVGDGVIDDTNAILLAIVSGSKKIYFPAGTYLMGKTINVGTGVELFGDGIGRTTIKWLGASNAVRPGETNYDIHYWRINTVKTLMHLIAGGSNIYIHDLEFDGSDFKDSSQRYIGLSVCGVTDTKIENVYIHHINYDLTRDASVQMEYAFQFFLWEFSSRIIINHCIGDYAGYENIGTEDVTDIIIRDSVWKIGWRTSLQIHRGSKRVKVVNNTINNDNIGAAHASLTIHGVRENPIEDLLIDGNNILSITNENQGYRGGVSFVQSGFKNVVFVSNTFDGNSYCMVDLLSDGSDANWPKNVTISNNIFKNTRYGICLLRGNNYIIKNNIIDSINVAINTNIQKYIISDNILCNNTTKTLAGTAWQD